MTSAIRAVQRTAPPKQDVIREAAKRVFLREGYGASMDLVAAEAGVSKQTVYNHFGSKEGLFRAIVAGLSEEFLTVLVEGRRVDDDPAATLRQLAQRFLGLLLAPSSLALHRMLVAEAPRFPDLARAVYMAGPAQAIERLAAYLEDQNRRRNLAVADPTLAAEQFFGGLTGQIHLRALLGVRTPSADEVGRTVDNVVGAFLRAHA